MAERKKKPKELPAVMEPELEVRKAYEAIAMTPRGGEGITLLMRKMYNILLFHAQSQGAELHRYKIPLKDVTSTAKFDSNDTALIKRYLKQMLSTTVEWYSSGDNYRSWEATTMLSYVKIAEEGGMLWLQWSYDGTIKEKLLTPGIYAKLSLQMQLQMRSGPAMVLYELATKYVDNFGGITMRNPWEWWRPVLTGTPDERVGAYAEYKYFKRDVLLSAIREVSQVSQFELELIEHKVGRRVVDIQFRVKRKAQTGLPLEDLNVLDAGLLEKMISIGLTQREAENYYVKYDEGLLRATMDNVERRMKRTPALVSPVAYFKDALKKGYVRPAAADATPPKQLPGRTTKLSREKAMNALKAQRSHEAEAMFGEMDEAGKEALLERWSEGATASARKSFQKLGLGSKVVQSEFYGWVAQETWGEPTESDLLEFLLARQAQ